MSVPILDWCLLAAMAAVIIGMTLYARRYMTGVAGFLVANRVGGRYLLTISNTFVGAIWLVALWEMTYSTGLPPQWWQMMSLPVGLFLSLTGFVVYRFRQTRALTLAQFFEMRYNRRFRLFSGWLCWISGMVNYGIFPQITSRLLVYFLRLPENFDVWGMTVPTLPAVMAAYMSIAVFVACAGGQITIMLTDFIQGVLLMIVFVIVMFYLMHLFAWGDLMSALSLGSTAEHSLTNPFGGSATEDFNVWFFLIGVFAAIYNIKSWQGNSAYNSAARNPHEAVVAGVVANWRGGVSQTCVAILIPVVCYAVLHLPQYADLAAPALEHLGTIQDTHLREQMTVPVTLSYLLPTGLLGLFAAVILGAAISYDDSYMHSWGSIFVQDVWGPLRKKPFTPKQHLRYLRLSIVGVALFAFIFSNLFPLRTYVLLFFALTGAIYLGGAGAVILGGLYWKRGTTRGAYAAMIAGTTLGFGGLLLEQAWPAIAAWLLPRFPEWTWLVRHADAFPINGQWIYFWAMLSASALYVVVSLLDRREPYNLDRLLHRGKYALTEDTVQSAEAKPIGRLARIIGITREFSRFERFLFYATFAWTMLWWGIFLIGTTIGLIWEIPDSLWSSYWYFLVWANGGLGLVCTVWILCGGIRDARRMFRDLREGKTDELDDGFVRPVRKASDSASSAGSDGVQEKAQ